MLMLNFDEILYEFREHFRKMENHGRFAEIFAKIELTFCMSYLQTKLSFMSCMSKIRN